MSTTTLILDDLRTEWLALEAANHVILKDFPGETGERQPVHTVYGGAHIWKGDTGRKMGGVALKFFDEYFAHPAVLGEVLGLGGFAEAVHGRVRSKLQSEAVEDFRIDFEDGYGNRPEAEEDTHALQSAAEVARGQQAGTLPPFLGIRVKPLTEELKHRSIRTLDLFLTALIRETQGRIPAPFVVTLPKITVPEQVTLLDAMLGQLERAHGLAPRTFGIELMVETTQAILAPDGAAALPRFVRAGNGRVSGAHFGTYDYTASCSITAQHQSMTHPSCDFAKHVMKVTLAGTTVALSDGATTIMPIARHRRVADGPPLTEAQEAENRRVIFAASKLHYDQARHSLYNGFYQGWDLHPAQLPTRYAAVYAFFLEGLQAATHRLKNFVEKAAQATLVGDTFDDAATGQGLLNYFLRGLSCGALTLDEALAAGLTVDELKTKSFVKILAGRRS